MSRIITNAEAQKKLKPAGSIAFDVPVEPFGVSQMIAEAAVGQGIIILTV
ncbi:MAG TPA: hypothetical protein VE221_03775 [Sphingomicrobium sp.]|jgi:hypothetical protein|nr:hypothetical protein [Sphingomicrobium sp.]